MSECDRFEVGFQSLIAGSPQLQQLEELVEHCKSCGDCRELFEMHRTLAHLGSAFDEQESVDLEEVHKSVMVEVASSQNRQFRSGWAAVFRVPSRLKPWAAAAVLAVVFMLGIFASRLLNSPSIQPESIISDEAFTNISLKNAENSPYTFSNVAVKELAANKISLAFDISKHVEIAEPANSELVKEILMHSMSNPTRTGAVGHFQGGSATQNFWGIQ